MAISKAELEMLTPEERAGITGADAEDGESGAEQVENVDKKAIKAEALADADDGDEEQDETGVEDDAPAKAAAKPADKAAAADADADAGEEEEDDTGPVIVAPMLKEESGRDFVKEKGDLRKLYDEGELSQDEYDEKRDAIARAESKADFAKDMNQATTEAKWKAEQDIFFGQYKQFEEKPGLRAALDAHVLRIDASTKGTLTGYQLLQQARKAVNAELGLVPAATDDEPAPKAASKTRPVPTQADATKRAGERAPKTLGDLPAADDGDAGENRFAHLDALANKGGMAFEQALAKMSAADQAEYLGQ